jgi:hypothetical protein
MGYIPYLGLLRPYLGRTGGSKGTEGKSPARKTPIHEDHIPSLSLCVLVAELLQAGVCVGASTLRTLIPS